MWSQDDAVIKQSVTNLSFFFKYFVQTCSYFQHPRAAVNLRQEARRTA